MCCCCRWFLQLLQDGSLEHPAKFFFGDLMKRALFGGRILHDFVLNVHASPFDDAQVIVSLLPDLTLFQLHSPH